MKGGVVYYLQDTGLDTNESTTYSVEFRGAKPVPPIGVGKRPGVLNFFIGDNRDDWRTNVPTFDSIVYKDLYPGIDLSYSLTFDRLKFEFHVSHGSDPDVITLGFEGVDALDIDDGSGDLLIRTRSGTVVEGAPYTYQYTPHGIIEVPSKYRITSDNIMTFSIDDYNPLLPLVIDPGLEISTYLGGSDHERANSIALDSSGNIYVAGRTRSTDFPTRFGVYNETNQGAEDIFVTKLNPSGSTMIWSTYIGGRASDEANDIALGSDGSIFIVGETESWDFPTTPEAFQVASNGGTRDAFLTKLAHDGSNLSFSTYIGGSYSERAYGVYLDGNDSAYITGYTTSLDFPTTDGSYDNENNGMWDVFVLKMDPSGTDPIFSTFYGGSNIDIAYDIALDDLGSIYLTGSTLSTDLPVSDWAMDTNLTGSDVEDAFIVKLKSDASDVIFSTLLGGNFSDIASSLSVDGRGRVCVAGHTKGSDFPTTSGVYDTSFNSWEGRNSDAFVTKVDEDGSDLVFSTFIGGTDDEMNFRVTEGPDGWYYLIGSTKSTGFPKTPGAFDSASGSNDGTREISISKLRSDGKELMFSTVIGGSDNDWGKGSVIDANGSIYVCGYTSSTDFPARFECFDSTYNGGLYDAFVIKVHDLERPTFLADLTSNETASGSSMEFNVSISDNEGVASAWVNYWTDDGKILNVTMVLKQGDRRHGIWSTVVEIPSTSPESLFYSFGAYDTSGLINWTENRTVRVLDRTAPTITDMSDTSGTTGDIITFRASISDNNDVVGARVEYWYTPSGGEHPFLAMVPVNVTSTGIGDYYLDSLVLPLSFIEPLTYRIGAVDSSGNWNFTEPRHVNVLDDDPPVLLDDRTDSLVLTGNPLEFVIDVSDNIGIANLSVSYWVDGNHANPEVIPLEPLNISIGGNGSYHILVETPNTKNATILSYLFTIVDISGNIFESDVRTREVTDDDAPVMVDDLSEKWGTTGDVLTLRVWMIDNIGIGQVNATLVTAEGTTVGRMEPVDVKVNGNGIYEFTHRCPFHSTESIDCSFQATDSSGNTATFEGPEVPVRDNDPPTFGEDLSDETAYQGVMTHYYIWVNDNIEVAEVYLVCSFWNGEIKNVSMTGDAPYHMGVLTPMDERGPVMYRFEAMDTSGNWNTTNGKEVVVTNAPPSVDSLPLWNVIEDTIASFDLKGFINDPNDDIGNLSVSINDTIVWVDGLVLKVIHDDWVPAYNITISVTDGKASTDAVLSIVVINNNDPPDVPVIISPEEGSRFKEGNEIVFEAIISDPDEIVGQTLTISWSSDIQGELATFDSTNLDPFTTTELTEGRHIITVSVSDGEYVSSASIEVRVDRTVGHDETPWYLVIILVLVIVLLVSLGVVHITRSDRKEED